MSTRWRRLAKVPAPWSRIVSTSFSVASFFTSFLFTIAEILAAFALLGWKTRHPCPACRSDARGGRS